MTLPSCCYLLGNLESRNTSQQSENSIEYRRLCQLQMCNYTIGFAVIWFWGFAGVTWFASKGPTVLQQLSNSRKEVVVLCVNCCVSCRNFKLCVIVQSLLRSRAGTNLLELRSPGLPCSSIRKWAHASVCSFNMLSCQLSWWRIMLRFWDEDIRICMIQPEFVFLS